MGYRGMRVCRYEVLYVCTGHCDLVLKEEE